jgi:hypothetical protein
MGRTILTCLHAFDGIGRAVRLKYKTYELDDIIANTLRLLGEGSKVAVKITLMATETGLIQMDEDIIAIEGTGHCADTAGLIKPSNVDRFSISEFEDFSADPGIFSKILLLFGTFIIQQISCKHLN